MTSSPAPVHDCSGAARAAVAESGRLRDALDALDAALDDTHPEGHDCDVCRAADELREIIEVATPPAPSDHGALDVGVIAQALHFADTGLMRGAPPDCADCEDKAAEYARLGPSDHGASGEREAERAHFQPASASTLGIDYLDEWGRRLYADDRDPGRPLTELIALAATSPQTEEAGL